MQNLLATHFIYCLQRLKDGSYIALNRRYKPIGHMGLEWVKYETRAERFQFKTPLTERDILAISCNRDANPECIYLYREGCFPTDGASNWGAYMQRINQLARLAVLSADVHE